MNFNAVDLLRDELFNTVDACIPNKAQNRAIKLQVDSTLNTLMNRIAAGWLDEQQNPGPPQPPAIAVPMTGGASSET